ncbi:MAG: acyl-CoA/acyl-ACP dehydrogenase, partial [Proteobacteria bacterium]|nr:acyl-CoA/acyl-ACP dehydrogenase [Pseudomonadota bacterium]
MPDHLPESLVAIREDAQHFVDKVLLPLAKDIENQDSVPQGIQEKVRQASKAAGFYYKTQPTEYGGDPAGSLELTMLRETWAAGNCRLTPYIFGPGPGILHAAEGELKENYLDPVMRGDKRGAFGFTEPDTAKRPTWARIEGETLLINGQKSYVTGGDTADFVAALVNVEHGDGSKAGTAMVVIDRDYNGVKIEREFSSMEGG